MLTTDDVDGTAERCSVTYKGFPDDVKKGTVILIDDGLIELTVQDVVGNNIFCKVLNGGRVSNNKGINVPNVRLSIPFLSERDKSDIKIRGGDRIRFHRGIVCAFRPRYTRHQRISCVARQYGHKNHCKIENMEGVRNADDIFERFDGLMVARGDLGVEVPLEEIPVIQKDLIKKVYNAGKQVSNRHADARFHDKKSRRQERKPLTLPNAIYDGTSAIMLWEKPQTGFIR